MHLNVMSMYTLHVKYYIWYINGEPSAYFASVRTLIVLKSCTVNYAAHS